MLLSIKVIPGARKCEVVEDQGQMKAYVRAPALDGRANEALRDLLAEHFSVRPSRIEIIKGLKSRTKLIKIGDI
ncbi:MAG: DUF167 domain-containing protein [Elusimicrobia bacterium]|nr:DUF167 domain-containing protein [Elusimicrobiota bacterium]